MTESEHVRGFGVMIMRVLSYYNSLNSKGGSPAAKGRMTGREPRK